MNEQKIVKVLVRKDFPKLIMKDGMDKFILDGMYRYIFDELRKYINVKIENKDELLTNIELMIPVIQIEDKEDNVSND